MVKAIRGHPSTVKACLVRELEKNPNMSKAKKLTVIRKCNQAAIDAGKIAVGGVGNPQALRDYQAKAKKLCPDFAKLRKEALKGV